jgi:sugar (pentulose or hexulose) kinase
MGLDLSGQRGRCLLLDVKSGSAMSTSRSWQHRMTAGFGYDLDTVEVWRLFGEAAREAMSKVGARPQDVLGVSTTGMRHGSIVVDARGEVLLAAPTRDAGASFTSALATFLRRCLRLPDYCGWRSRRPNFSAGRMRCWD